MLGVVNPHYVIQRLNTHQAAQVAGRARVTIARALEAGELHGTQAKPRGRWLIDPRCLEAWLNGEPCYHSTGAEPGPPTYAFLPPSR